MDLDIELKELHQLSKKPHLRYLGNKKLLQKQKVSIVGTRKPINYTKNITHEISSKLSQRGVCIVSGGAIGVDSIAHRSAGVDNTILVSPCGLNHIYPAINKDMIKDISKSGLLFSMFDDNFRATKYSFVQRNEVVVGLGDILIVTQADRKSGSLRSVEFALKMKKKIYVLPHRLGDSDGTNDLLKNSLATAIYDVDEFVNSICEVKSLHIEDEFLEFCSKNPSYDEAVSMYADKVFEYELLGKITVQNNTILVC
jgi:DNA processing protein